MDSGVGNRCKKGGVVCLGELGGDCGLLYALRAFSDWFSRRVGARDVVQLLIVSDWTELCRPIIDVDPNVRPEPPKVLGVAGVLVVGRFVAVDEVVVVRVAA